MTNHKRAKRRNKVSSSTMHPARGPGRASIDARGRPYWPNDIPLIERARNLLLSSALLAYGALSIWIDDLYLPGKTGTGIHLHGAPAKVMSFAMLCACANLISVVIDHHDRRNNQASYQRFGQVSQIAGWVAFGLALVLDFLALGRSPP